MAGRLIVIEGLDGSGKQTQTMLLAEGFRELGLHAQSISFPWYGEPSAAPVEEYLSGIYGTDSDEVNAYGASILYAADRFASYRKHWKALYGSCDVLVSDRYVGSNAIHQCSKLPRSEWGSFVRWLEDLEFNRVGLPRPDSTIYLRVDSMTSAKLLVKRYQGDASKRDIHEANESHIVRSREAADWCAANLGWQIVECGASGSMRTIADIQDEIRLRLGMGR